jgi:hypothetical protein
MHNFLLCLAVTLLVPIGAPRAWASSAAGPYSLELLDENGSVLPTFWKGGQIYILGAKGQRYSLRIRNQSGNRVEFVASVDGRDVLDGHSAAFDKRGYIVGPRDQVVVDGFRLDHESVAAFRFSSVKDSYAAQLGAARDVGVIGVAVFAERQPRYVPPMRQRSYLFAPSTKSAGDPSDAAKSDASAAAPPAADALAGGRFDKKASQRPGLGTEFGEQRSSHVDEVAFERAGSSPSSVLSVRYNDRAGLRAMGVNVDPVVGPREAELRESAQPFPGNFCAPPPGWGN